MQHESHLAIRLRAKAYVLDVQVEKDFESDVTERVCAELAAHGIGRPAIPHRHVA